MSIKKLLSCLLPYTCILCGSISTRDQDLCSPCFRDLPEQYAMLLSCNRPFDACYALYSYQPPIDRLLLELKFNQELINARVLGELMAEKILNTWYKSQPLPDILIPVPLHAARLKERGYNQAVEIARPIAKALRIPMNLTACQRLKPTLPQAMLHASDRELNVKQAFSTNTRFDGQYIAVIDDVITTGHTLREFCQLLKNKGAERIDVWCCARPRASYSHS